MYCTYSTLPVVHFTIGCSEVIIEPQLNQLYENGPIGRQSMPMLGHCGLEVYNIQYIR